MRFWDSSAILPLLLDGPFSETARALLESDAELVVWWGAVTECCSALARLRREGRITVEEERSLRSRLDRLASFWTEMVAGDAVRSTASRLLLRHPLRAADSLQLAAALVWSEGRPDGLFFVCLDGRLRDAARAEGFLVEPQEEVFQAGR